jgi:hypothetical protein
MLVCVFRYPIARETAGAARIRLSLRPLIGEGVTLTGKPRAKTRREIAKSWLRTFTLVITRESG